MQGLASRSGRLSGPRRKRLSLTIARAAQRRSCHTVWISTHATLLPRSVAGATRKNGPGLLGWGPGTVRVIGGDLLGEVLSIVAQVLLQNVAVLVHQKRHDPAITILRRISKQGKTPG